MAGDFNIHAERATDLAKGDFLDLQASFGGVQKVPLEPTQRDGETIDLVITKLNQTLDNIRIDLMDTISDHGLVIWQLPSINIHQLHSIDRLEAGKESTM